MLSIFYLVNLGLNIDVDHEEGDIYRFEHGNYIINLILSKSKEKAQEDIMNESREDKAEVEDTKSESA